MANIFLAIPQYKKMPEAEVRRIAEALELNDWKPSMGGFHPMFDISVNNLINWAAGAGHKIRLCCVHGDGNLPRVRSFQAAIWKWEYEHEIPCDYFMVVDEDISFDPQAIEYLMNDDKPIVGGIYTFKTQNENYTGKVCTRLIENEIGDMSGPFKVRWLNGGFIMTKAEALNSLIAKYEELEFQVQQGGSMGIEKAWALWCPFVHDKVFLSEDWAYSQRARDAGYEIWADWRCDLTHWSGENGYKISYKAREEI